jgi:hypothetical protein
MDDSLMEFLESLADKNLDSLGDTIKALRNLAMYEYLTTAYYIDEIDGIKILQYQLFRLQ